LQTSAKAKTSLKKQSPSSGRAAYAALPPFLAYSQPRRKLKMTVLRKPIKRELPERIAHRQMIVELHPGFIRLREKRSRTAWDISWESAYWKAAEIQARRQRPDRGRAWRFKR
jgi:hypothetical protein